MTRYLRAQVAFWWTALVLAVLGTAVWRSGGFGLTRSALGRSALIATLLGSAVFAVGLHSFPAMQRWALRENADVDRVKQVLRFVAIFTGCFGLGILIDAALRQL